MTLADEVLQQAFLDVVDILDPVGQVLRHREELAGVRAQDGGDGILGRDVRGQDRLGKLAGQDLVLEHAQVEVEDAGCLFAQLVGGALAEVEDFLLGDADGLAQAGELALGRFGGDEAVGDVELLSVDDNGMGDGHAW